MKHITGTILVTWLSVIAGFAHDYFPGFAQSILHVQENELRYELNLGAPELAAVASIDLDRNNQISGEEISRAEPIIAEYIRKHLLLSVKRKPLLGKMIQLELHTHSGNRALPPQEIVPLDAKVFISVILVFPYPKTGGDLDVRYSIFIEANKDYTCPARILHEGEELAFTFSSREPLRKIRLASHFQMRVAQARDFFRHGVFHLLTGYDHMLFLLSLLLVSKHLREVVIIITAFTISHTVTLSLAALNIFVLPTRFTESIIALSIAYVAIENLRGKHFAPRWATTFCFGFIHGFGFASTLGNLGIKQSSLAISLVSFNVGVEFGQLIVVLLAWYPLQYLSKRRNHRQFVVAASTLVIVLSFYWFVQRAFFIK